MTPRPVTRYGFGQTHLAIFGDERTRHNALGTFLDGPLVTLCGRRLPGQIKVEREGTRVVCSQCKAATAP